jgi:hypothetical protein
MRLMIAVAIFVASFSCFSPNASADPAECQDAIAAYNSAIDDVSTALRRYSSCLSNSQGHDDCSIQFRRLRSAQSDFESAVSRYGLECN